MISLSEMFPWMLFPTVAPYVEHAVFLLFAIVLMVAAMAVLQVLLDTGITAVLWFHKFRNPS